MNQDLKYIERSIARLYPHYNLRDQLYMIYGSDYEDLPKRQIIRVIAKNLIDLTSPELMIINTVGEIDMTVIQERIVHQIRWYVEYIVAVANHDHNLFNQKDPASLKGFFIELKKVLDDVDTYTKEVKEGGYKAYITNNASGLYGDAYAKVYVTRVLTAFSALLSGKKEGSDRYGVVSATYAEMFFQLAMLGDGFNMDEEKPEPKDNPFGTGREIPFTEARQELGIKDNRTLKKLMDEAGLKYIETANKNFIRESNLEKIKIYRQQKGSD